MTMRNKDKDTKYTKLFVGGIPYKSDDDALRNFFTQFGEIDEAVVIKDRTTNKSKGYGFVTMVTTDAAELACRNRHPIIDGRQANVNLAYLGAKPKPPRIPGKLSSTSPTYSGAFQPGCAMGPSPHYAFAPPGTIYSPPPGPSPGPLSPLSVIPPQSPSSHLGPVLPAAFQQPCYVDCNGNAMVMLYPVYEQPYYYPPNTTYVASPTANNNVNQVFTFPTVASPASPPLNGVNGTPQGQQFFQAPPFEMVGHQAPQVQ